MSLPKTILAVSKALSNLIIIFQFKLMFTRAPKAAINLIAPVPATPNRSVVSIQLRTDWFNWLSTRSPTRLPTYKSSLNRSDRQQPSSIMYGSGRPSTSNARPADEFDDSDLPANFQKLRRVPPKASPAKQPIKRHSDNRYEKEEFEFNSSLIDKIYRYVYIVTDHFLSHPFVRLRKVIQLDRSTEPNSYHLTPVSIVPIMFRIQAKYGVNGLMQGLTSVLITKGMCWYFD